MMAIQHCHGGCQCGAVKYEVVADLDRTFICNCSRCQKLGSVLAFTPRDSFVLQAGEQKLTEYLFNTHVMRHFFCKVCGIQSFAYGAMPDGTPMVAINVNCLEGVEPRQLKSHLHDGKNQ
jgi:hypothetical protein